MALELVEDREELIARIKECAQTLINNAESIVGTEKELRNLSIHIDVTSWDKVPVIEIKRELMPEGFIKRVTEESNN